jgi:hypothetical protein
MDNLDKYIIPYNNTGIYYWDELKLKTNKNELIVSKTPSPTYIELEKGIEPLPTNNLIRNK